MTSPCQIDLSGEAAVVQKEEGAVVQAMNAVVHQRLGDRYDVTIGRCGCDQITIGGSVDKVRLEVKNALDKPSRIGAPGAWRC